MFVTHADILDGKQFSRLQDVFPGMVEVGSGDGHEELRTRGLGVGPEDWTPVRSSFTAGETVSVDAGSAPAPDDPDEPGPPEFDSLFEFIETTTTAPSHLTLINPEVGEEAVGTVEEYFTRLNVDVREPAYEPSTPTDVAMLHRGEELIATSTLPDLRDALTLADDTEEAGVLGPRAYPDVLRVVNHGIFGVEGVDTQFLLRVSRMIEMAALRDGTGVFRVGFQALDRFVDHDQTVRLYRKLAATGADVHVYGRPTPEPAVEDVTFHAHETDEIASCWFMAYRGESPDHARMLLTEERERDAYYGFWTHKPAFATALNDYLAETY